MFKLSDRVKESTITTGSGDISLAGPYGGFQSFREGIGKRSLSTTTYYAIENGVQWEVGQGIYSRSSETLSRDIVFDSSSGGSLISLTGVSVVFCTLPADKALVIDDDGAAKIDYINANSGTFEELSTNNLTVENNLDSSGDIRIVGDGNFGGDVIVSGGLTTGGDILSSGLLTLVRPNSAGNFFHAYKDDSSQRTISLHGR